MFDDDKNPWNRWISQHGQGTFAHPNAPAGGTGYGGSRVPGTIGSRLYEGNTDPYSPVGIHMMLQDVAEGYAKYELRRTIEDVRQASSLSRLSRVTSRAFGLSSFSQRLGAAVDQDAGGDGRSVLQMEKIFVRAELYDYLSGRVRWRSAGNHSWSSDHPPELWQLGQYLSGDHASLPELLKSAQWRDGLMKELTELFTKPAEALALVKAQLKPRAFEHWAHCSEQAKQNGPISGGDAGWHLGVVLLEVVATLATLVKAKGFAAKLSTVAPRLLDLATYLRNARDASGVASNQNKSVSAGPGQTPSGPVAARVARAQRDPALAAIAPAPRGEPKSLDECVQRLQEARTRLAREGYKPKYTDAQLLAIASKGEMNDRFLVTLQKKKPETETIGYKRDSGRAPYWGTTFDQLENADTDFALIASLQGMTTYNPKDDYVLIIVDRGIDHKQNADVVISPTWDNMQKFGVKEFGNGSNETVLREVMTPAYKNTYAAQIADFNKTIHPKTGEPLNQFNAKNVEYYPKAKAMSPLDKERFTARHKFRTEIGANPDFLGTGTTKWNGGTQKYGTVETLTLPKNPPTIAELKLTGKVRVIR